MINSILDIKDNLNCNLNHNYCKVYCNKCNLYWNCVNCHNNEIIEHILINNTIRQILCILCQKIQKTSNKCNNCNTIFSEYYCDKCKIWRKENKNIYHCNKCKICKLGIKSKSYHCDKCNLCFSNINRHKCFENKLKSNCPICYDNLYYSKKDIIMIECGHLIHKECFNLYIKSKLYDNSNYNCPICKQNIF